jgi:5-methyltetrahydropteroyltriglutamate--homocysteine methyltransferase
MRRLDFNLGFYEHLLGLEPLPVGRRLGPEGHDQRGKWLVAGPLTAPAGLGIVDDYRYLLATTDRPTKATVPGPFTLAGRLELNGVYADRFEAAADLATIVNAECKALVEAGADFVQVDEPSMAVYPDRPADLVALFNRTVAGVDAKIATHLCFGNYRGRPVARRRYAPLLPHLQEFDADQFLLEFANRELAELDLWREFGGDKELAAGLIDVKNYACETPQDVAERVRTALQYVPVDKLWVVPDCGWSQTARWATVRKLRSMVEGVAIVRRELAG